MKYAVSSYSFSQLIDAGELTQKDCIRKAKEMGFDGIELVDIDRFAPGSLPDYAKELAEEAAQVGIAVSNLTFLSDLINGSQGDGAAEVRRVKGFLDAAALFDVPTIRHDVLYSLGRFRSFYDALPTLAEACREIAEYGAEKGIRTTIENHGMICQDSLRVEALFQAVNHPNFSLLADMGNFLCVDEDPATAVSRVAPYAAYVHAKDFLVKPGNGIDPGEGFFRSRGGNYLRGTVIGHGVVPVKQCLDILKAAGYDGWVTVEYEGMEPALTGIPLGLANLKRYSE